MSGAQSQQQDASEEGRYFWRTGAISLLAASAREAAIALCFLFLPVTRSTQLGASAIGKLTLSTWDSFPQAPSSLPRALILRPAPSRSLAVMIRIIIARLQPGPLAQAGVGSHSGLRLAIILPSGSALETSLFDPLPRYWPCLWPPGRHVTHLTPAAVTLVEPSSGLRWDATSGREALCHIIFQCQLSETEPSLPFPFSDRSHYDIAKHCSRDRRELPLAHPRKWKYSTYVSARVRLFAATACRCWDDDVEPVSRTSTTSALCCVVLSNGVRDGKRPVSLTGFE
ncbi:hypothetical protein CC78DRAFT_576801 [Lojkania enalia]|uniref:Uncharacterized protein n=1 Tax=Lojkania enalia TaxID=147567 RepID=A0A9P4N923_9PLEO|nr:hypothetical protein CC78DRAFT_576801 [Didymosphaeria enalia]